MRQPDRLYRWIEVFEARVVTDTAAKELWERTGSPDALLALWSATSYEVGLYKQLQSRAIDASRARLRAAVRSENEDRIRQARIDRLVAPGAHGRGRPNSPRRFLPRMAPHGDLMIALARRTLQERTTIKISAAHLSRLLHFAELAQADIGNYGRREELDLANIRRALNSPNNQKKLRRERQLVALLARQL